MSLLGTILLYLHYSISAFHLAVFFRFSFPCFLYWFSVFPLLSLGFFAAFPLDDLQFIGLYLCYYVYSNFSFTDSTNIHVFFIFFQPQDLGNFIMLLLSFHIIRSECRDTHPHTHTHRHIYNLIAFSHAAQTKSCECRQMPLGGKITLCEKRVQQSEIAVCDLKC